MRSLTRAARSSAAVARSASTARTTRPPVAQRLQRWVGNEAAGRLFEAATRAPLPDPAADAIPRIVHDVLHSPGEPLPPAIRAEMEARFSADFSDVAVHTGGYAGQSAAAVGAKAYTVGRHIVFGTGEYAPGTAPGRELLAHELAHVVQQRRGGVPASSQPDAELETGAREAAAAVVQGEGPIQVSGAAGVGLARQPSGLAEAFGGGRRLHPHTVTFKSLQEFAHSDAGSPYTVDLEDGTVTATLWRPYPPATVTTPKPPAPVAKPVAKPQPKAVPKPEPPVDIHLLMDMAEAMRPRLIYPKPVHQFFGGVQAIGGGLEIVGGGFALFAPEPVATKVAGGIVILHGADTAWAGLQTAWTGDYTPTYAFRGGYLGARNFGADEKLANAFGQSADIFAGAASTGLSLQLASIPINNASLFNGMQITRWGAPGLSSGDWVMQGGATRWNYGFSFKWQPGFGNKFAPFNIAETYTVPAYAVKWPQGFGLDAAWKGLFGQRVFEFDPTAWAPRQSLLGPASALPGNAGLAPPLVLQPKMLKLKNGEWVAE